MVLRKFKPLAGENRMKGAGDVTTARARWFERPSANLKVVVENRYRWMNRFIQPSWSGIELGCGSGLSREFIQCRSLKLTDYAEYPWLDVPRVDALATPFADGEFDFAMSVNVIHHLAQPLRFFREMARIIRPGGRLLVQDVHASLFLRAALRLQRHEGYDYDVDVFDESASCTDPEDPWAGNNAIVDLLLADEARMAASVPTLRRVHKSHSEFLTLLNSGGVVAKSVFVPLPMPLARAVERLDRALIERWHDTFAAQVQLVYERL